MWKNVARLFRGAAKTTASAAASNAAAHGTGFVVKTLRWTVPPVALGTAGVVTAKGGLESLFSGKKFNEAVGEQLGLYDQRDGWAFASAQSKQEHREAYETAQTTPAAPSTAQEIASPSASADVSPGGDMASNILDTITAPFKDFAKGLSGGNAGQSFDNMFGGLLSGKGGIMGILSTIVGAYMVFGSRGWLSKLAGAMILIFGLGSGLTSSKQNAQAATLSQGQNSRPQQGYQQVPDSAMRQQAPAPAQSFDHARAQEGENAVLSRGM